MYAYTQQQLDVVGLSSLASKTYIVCTIATNEPCCEVACGAGAFVLSTSEVLFGGATCTCGFSRVPMTYDVRVGLRPYCTVASRGSSGDSCPAQGSVQARNSDVKREHPPGCNNVPRTQRATRTCGGPLDSEFEPPQQRTCPFFYHVHKIRSTCSPCFRSPYAPGRCCHHWPRRPNFNATRPTYNLPILVNGNMLWVTWPGACLQCTASYSIRVSMITHNHIEVPCVFF